MPRNGMQKMDRVHHGFGIIGWKDSVEFCGKHHEAVLENFVHFDVY